MKNSKSVLMGMLALALTVGLVLAGCKSPVEVDVGKVSKVKTVTATKTANGAALIVEWDAVSNVGAVGYELFLAEDGKTIKSPVDGFSNGFQVQNNVTYDKDSGAPSANTDYNKWSVKIEQGDFNPYVKKAGTYKIGVRTYDDTANTNKASSAIVWAKETIPLAYRYPLASNVAAVASGTDGSGSVDVSWTQPVDTSDWDYTATATLYDENGTSQDTLTSTCTTASYSAQTFTNATTLNSGRYKVQVEVSGSWQGAAPAAGTIEPFGDVYLINGDGAWSNTVSIAY